MNIGDLKTSRYLKKEDVGDGTVVTISGLTKQNVAMEGAEESLKFVLHFEEFDKPMVLNSTNGQVIAKVTGISEDIETAWVGKKIVLYNDPAVSFGGKLTGGIRARALNKAELKDSGIPF